MGLLPEDREGVLPMRRVLEWAEQVTYGKWNWARNSRCKYVTLKIDTRSGAYQILDRDNVEITPEQLFRQGYTPAAQQEEASRHG